MGALTYAIGDLHGRLDLLEDLTARCLADAARRGCSAPLFVTLGDYVDRGPDPAGVIALLRRFSAEHRVVALVGNHDTMMINTVLGDDALRCASAPQCSLSGKFHDILLDRSDWRNPPR